MIWVKSTAKFLPKTVWLCRECAEYFSYSRSVTTDITKETVRRKKVLIFPVIGFEEDDSDID